MNFRVVIHDRAAADIAGVARWIAQDSLQESLKWIDRMVKKIDSLKVFPTRCAIAPESPLRGHEIRYLIVGSYRILFTIKKRTVHILYVRHCARQSLSAENP